jgi:DNA-binding NarL/FixJ family response regulator
MNQNSLGGSMSENKSLSLTKRETDVVNLVIQGLSNKKIGEKLFVTEGTVKSYIHNILTKFNIKSRYEIINYFVLGDNKFKLLSSDSRKQDENFVL